MNFDEQFPSLAGKDLDSYTRKQLMLHCKDNQKIKEAINNVHETISGGNLSYNIHHWKSLLEKQIGDINE